MNKFSTKKRYYYKPTIVLEVIDYAISMGEFSGQETPAMKNPNTSTPQKQSTSPFGGSKPKYK